MHRGAKTVERVSRGLHAPGRFLRWVFLLIGGSTVLPIPLLTFLLPVLVLVFGAPADQRPAEMILTSAIAGPGLFLVATVALPMLIVALPLPVAMVLGIGELATRRRRVGVSVLDQEPGPTAGVLDRLLERVGNTVARFRGWTRGRVPYIGAGSFAALLVALSFVIRDEDLLPWNAGLLGLLGAGLFFLALSLWSELLIKAIDWIRKPPGLRADAGERGRRRLEPETERAVVLARCRAEREPVTGVVTSARPFRSLAGEEVVAARLRGDVGDWTIDDAFVAPELTLRLDGGRDVQVQATDWLVPLDVPTPRPFEPTLELDGRLEPLGIARGKARLAEAVLRVGDRVRVYADATREHAPGEGYRDGLTLVLRAEPDRPAVLERA